MIEPTILVGEKLLEIMCSKPLTKGEWKVLRVLAEEVDEENRLAAQIAPIAREAGVSYSTAARSIASLIQRGVMRAIPTPLMPHVTTYFLNPYALFGGDEILLDEVIEEYDAL